MQTPNYSYFDPPPAYGSGLSPEELKLKSVENFKQKQGLNLDATMAGASTGNPYIAGAGLGVDLVGMGIQAYGAAEERKAAESAAERAEKRYQQQLARQQLMDRQREEQQRRMNEEAYGQYALNYENQAQNLYGQYQ